jgi:nucleoside-diphosphate-sugar epimerase
MKVCVTGASGRAGHAVVTDLLEHGYEVRATDLVSFAGLGVPVLRADLTEYGEATEVLHGMDAVVHLANIPAGDILTDAKTFEVNMTMNFNVFQAATKGRLRRVVWASSETTIGLPFDVPPRYAPIDEDHYPYPTSTYSLSKVATETIAEQFAAWSGIPFVALRFSNILGPADYRDAFPGYWSDPMARKWNLWGYIDERDAAASCRLALTADVTGASSYIIAAADTVMPRPSMDLLAEVFPGVALTREVGEFETLLSIERAREVLGFVPQHRWRDHVQPPT